MPRGVVKGSGIEGGVDLPTSHEDISSVTSRLRIKELKIDLEEGVNLQIKLLTNTGIYKGTKLGIGYKMKKLR
ncbi:hypothetical protein [Muriicola sp.]|uniref:hypothetical protein n=1 Tax=Muriicola sp. TaxID=2020856 RepID=UPI003C777CEB